MIMKKRILILCIYILFSTISFSQVRDLWMPDKSGISYKKKNNNYGNVGIGISSFPNIALTILQRNSFGAGSAAMDIVSEDAWQTATRFRNTSVKQEYQFNLAGDNNSDHTPGSFGVFHATNNLWLWHSNPNNSYVGIGSYSHKAPFPKSRLHVFNGDINIEDIGSGIIMKSPNGKCWRVTIDDNGNFVSSPIESF